MGVLDYVIIAIVVAAAVCAVIFLKKGSSCNCGECGSCKKCADKNEKKGL